MNNKEFNDYMNKEFDKLIDKLCPPKKDNNKTEINNAEDKKQ